MSKKTKRQKILAELHRKEMLLRIPVSSSEEKIRMTTPKISRINIPIVKQTQNESIYLYPVQQIRKDLTKTLGLCILAISLEIALYFVLEKNITLPFLVK